jgi:hypothetical protein
MKKSLYFSLIILLVISSLRHLYPQNVSASGTFFTKPGIEVIPSESQAAIFFDGKKETLFESVTFSANPVVVWNFAWLLAVPSKPDVELVKDELFAQLSKVSQKTLTKDSLGKRILFWNVEETPDISSELFTRPVNISKLDVLSPPNSRQKLDEWVSYSGYVIPKQAEVLLKEYEEKNWYFIVAEIDALHLELAAYESLTLAGAHTFPLKITFDTDHLVYPMRLTTIQPDTDTSEIPLTYTYGSKSEDVLGVKDEAVDALLSKPSANKYPKIPFAFNYYKTELYTFTKNKTSAPNFITQYANYLSKNELTFKDAKGESYYSLSDDGMFLTKLASVRPVLQLDDISFSLAKNNRRVNSSSYEYFGYVKIAAAFVVLGILTALIKRRKKLHE